MKSNVSILLFQSKDRARWIAQCIEYDIAAQGATITDAIFEFERTYYGQQVVDMELGNKPLSTTPAAPDCFRKKFNEALEVNGRPLPRFSASGAGQPEIAERDSKFRILA